METEALERPADLALWRTGPATAMMGQPRRFASLKEAISAAAGALNDPTVQPWIVTADGDMLAPTWIRTYLA